MASENPHKISPMQMFMGEDQGESGQGAGLSLGAQKYRSKMKEAKWIQVHMGSHQLKPGRREVVAPEKGGGKSRSYMVFRQSRGSRRLWQQYMVYLQRNKHCQTAWSKRCLSYTLHKATFWSIKKSAKGEPILDLSEWFSQWLFQWSIWSNDSNFQAFCQLTENEHQTSDYMPEVTYWIKQSNK